MKHTQEELERKYAQIPQEIKQLRRWICYDIRKDSETGEEKKVPINSITNEFARINDPTTWTNFRIAVLGCVKYGLYGIGFVLGNDENTQTNYFGIDLDNHADKVTGKKPMNEQEFNDFSTEFVNALNSYTEYSHSGEGIHIICKGTLPVGSRRRNGCAVEMYDKCRFFTMTGKVINNVPINERTEEIKPLWEKYLNVQEEIVQPTIVSQGNGKIVFGENVRARTIETSQTILNDDELIEKIKNSQYGNDFVSLYNGNMSAYGNDHSAADLALCKILAFWTNCDFNQTDRIFRRSALMRPKWEQRRTTTTRRGVCLGEGTYGSQTIEYAFANQVDGYKPPRQTTTVVEKIVPNVEIKTKQEPISQEVKGIKLDENFDPIVSVKNIFKTYSLTDTGNAERFYDYFGDNFRYNADNKFFMFWDGKTWLRDGKAYIKKYANELINVCKSEITNTHTQITDLEQRGESGKEELARLKNIEKKQLENLTKISNKAGKEAYLSEFQVLHEIPVKNDEFDTQENLLNTDSGVVDLNNGKIMPFDKELKLSKNTNCKVSYEEPKVWIKFLHDIFEREKPEETEEIINVMQLALGESLFARTNKEHLFIMYGNGSNGKSTFIRVVNDAFGDYGTAMNSDMLIQKPNSSSQSNEFSLSALLGARLVSTSETAEGKKLDEVMIKQMLSGEKLVAQFKYGNSFTFRPCFSPWMSTNNKPIIRATDYGTWRRIFFVPFLNTFDDKKKDVDMPKKLEKEMPQILGWMIKGAVKLHNEYQDKLPKPQCLEMALTSYKEEMDVITAFLNDRCIDFPEMEIEASKLYSVYNEWAKVNNEYCHPESRFKIEMAKKGYKIRKDLNRGWLYKGLKLATDKRGIRFGDDDE